MGSGFQVPVANHSPRRAAIREVLIVVEIVKNGESDCGADFHVLGDCEVDRGEDIDSVEVSCDDQLVD